MKTYNIQYRIGRAKYVVNSHNDKFHPDGSKFYDIDIFRSKLKMNEFIKQLTEEGFKHEN